MGGAGRTDMTTGSLSLYVPGNQPALRLIVNRFAASYLNTQGLNNSCLKSRQLRPYSI